MTMNLSYDRLMLIGKLEKAIAKRDQKRKEYQKNLRQAAIRQCVNNLRGLRTGKGKVSVYVEEEGLRDTFHQPERVIYTPDTQLDYILKQLKLSDVKKIRLGQDDSLLLLRNIEVED